jgi:hypothetical protein
MLLDLGDLGRQLRGLPTLVFVHSVQSRIHVLDLEGLDLEFLPEVVFLALNDLLQIAALALQPSTLLRSLLHHLGHLLALSVLVGLVLPHTLAQQFEFLPDLRVL